MRVLLTRAKEDAARSAARLAAAGHTALVSPLIDIVDLSAAIPSEGFDALVVTSAHASGSAAAARFAADHGATPLWVVGARTLAAALLAGLRGPALVAPDAAALVAEVAQLASRPRRALYLAGADRKPTLEAGLAQLGIVVTTREVYAARAAAGLNDEAAAALRRGLVDVALHYSPRSAALFVAAASRAGVAPDACRHACLSGDAAAPLRAAGASRIDVAAAPTEDALLQMLTRPPGRG